MDFTKQIYTDVYAVLLVPSCIVSGGYFNVLLNLAQLPLFELRQFRATAYLKRGSTTSPVIQVETFFWSLWNLASSLPFTISEFTQQDQVVQKVDSTIPWMNLYPVDNTIGFCTTYPLDSDLPGG